MFGCLLIGTVSQAQGILRALPTEEGKWVRFEGTYTQIIERPNDATGKLNLKWTRHVTIKALGAEDAEFRGATEPCRWVEIKVITGPDREGIIDAGPGGVRIYKILIPTRIITEATTNAQGEVVDANNILASFVPIVKGWRKIGNESPAPITSKVFQLFPAVSLLQHYRQVQSSGDESVPVGQESVTATHLTGDNVIEDSFTRATSKGEVWNATGPLAPFGTVKWRVSTIMEGKASTDARTNFKQVSEIIEDLVAAEVGDGGESELDTDNLN